LDGWRSDQRSAGSLQKKPGAGGGKPEATVPGRETAGVPHCARDDSHTQMWDTSWGRAMRQRRAFGRGDQDEEAH
jgi:hypothetical protein